MSKYFYIALGSILALVITAVAILSHLDRVIFTSLPSDTTAVSSPKTTKPYHTLSSQSQDEITPSPGALRSHPAPNLPPLPPSKLDLKLVGTTVWGEKSSAIIEDLTSGTQGVYRIGDSVKGFTLTTILSDSVTLTRGDQEVILPLAKGSEPLSPEEFVQKTGPNAWIVSSEKITDMITNVAKYQGQVIVFQHRENGKPAGFLIRHLTPGNDFEKMGIENGDIIQKVNGIEVNDLSDTLQAVYELSQETSFRVEIVRNGQPQTLSYTLDKNVSSLVPIITNLMKIPIGQ